MLMQRLKRSIQSRLLDAAASAADRPFSHEMRDESLSQPNRGTVGLRAISWAGNTSSWTSPSLILTTARAASGV